MEFRYEHEMAAPARRWLAEQDMMVKAEFTTPWGICDLVGVSLNKERVCERLRLGQRNAVGPLIRVEILNAIPDAETHRSTTVEAMMSNYRDILTPSQLQAEIDKLVAGKFVRVSKRGTLQRVNGWAPLHRRIVALELKLTRVQDALAQAASHQAFADESYVGLPTELAERAVASPRGALLLGNGVGVLSVGSEQCKVLLRPGARQHPADLALQMHCVERFWRTRPKGN